jgi:L-alanine-DL-glutamate epimerase-like enolase superfamily enzyme
MNTRRLFLKSAAAAAAAAGGVMGWQRISRASEGKPLVVRDAKIIRVRDRKGGATDSYLEITSESGLIGYAGPLLKEQAAALPADLRALLAGRDAADGDKLNFATLWAACRPGKALETYAEGKDPLTGAAVWGVKRTSRHTETGWSIMALSAVDLALWDLRGKAAGQPVWRLLGAKRKRLAAYASMLGYSVKPAEAGKAAREFFDKGFKLQKWFFASGPADGDEGLKRNIELVRAIREELGAEARLMFDGIQYVWNSGGSDDRTMGDYAISLAKGILPYKPHWLEEPLRPDDLEGYTRLKGETGITLAAGEHWYTRWNVKPFLDRKIVSFVQSDPEWCGGISEWLNICEMAGKYPGVQVVPHGHHVLAASNCVASQGEDLCPMLEYLVRSRTEFQHCQTRPMVAEAGTFPMADEPGLGPSLDEARMERV